MPTFTKAKVSPLKRQKDLKEARRILNIEKGAGEASIREQFKHLVRANHPDGKQADDYGGRLTMEKLIWAKNILISEVKNEK